jgi:hypothetical protein
LPPTRRVLFQDLVEAVKQASGFWAVLNEVPESLLVAGALAHRHV